MPAIPCCVAVASHPGSSLQVLTRFLACAGIHASVAGGGRPSCLPCCQSSWSSRLLHVASGSPRQWSGGAPWARPLFLATVNKACRGQAALALATSVILLTLADSKAFARHDNWQWLCIGLRCTTAACHHGGGPLPDRAVGFVAYAVMHWRLHSALYLLHIALRASVPSPSTTSPRQMASRSTASTLPVPSASPSSSPCSNNQALPGCTGPRHAGHLAELARSAVRGPRPLCAILDTICEAPTSVGLGAPTHSLSSWQPSAESSQPKAFVGASRTQLTVSCGYTQTLNESLHPVTASPSTLACTAPDARRAPLCGPTARGSKTSSGPATAHTPTCPGARHVTKAASSGARLWRATIPSP